VDVRHALAVGVDDDLVEQLDQLVLDRFRDLGQRHRLLRRRRPCRTAGRRPLLSLSALAKVLLHHHAEFAAGGDAEDRLAPWGRSG
jgi:hypothetical protein